MINNWMIPRAKRKLTSVVYALSAFSYLTTGTSWKNEHEKQLQFETILERLNLKAVGQRRDQRAGGARTYETWFNLLGLIYTEQKSGVSRLTLAGEEIIKGVAPVPIITKQLMTMQYPSPYSLRSGVRLHTRFKIRPFRFLLRLLASPELGWLSEDEIARFVITEGENESPTCFRHVVSTILEYRAGRYDLPTNFPELYPSSKRPYVTSPDQTLRRLKDNANTFINYLEYTQMIRRSDSQIALNPDKADEIHAILEDGTKLSTIDPKNEEQFQRHFGLPPGKLKDTRRFGQGELATKQVLEDTMIRTQFLYLSGTKPITVLTPEIVREIAEKTGLSEERVDKALERLQVDTLGVFEASFVDMAFAGTESATEFEKATVEVFQELGYDAVHVGPKPLHPDVAVTSPMGYTGIIDNKAYRAYSINNDHRNRMVYNYIPTYQKSGHLAFFSYVAGGFGNAIDAQILKIAEETDVHGSAITAKDLITLLRAHRASPIPQEELKSLFQANRRINWRDISTH